MRGQHTRTAIATGACVTLGTALAVTLGAVPRDVDGHASISGAPLASVVKIGAAALQTPERVAHHAVAHHAAAKTAHITSSAAVDSATTHVATAESVSASKAASTASVPANKPATKQPAKHHKKPHHNKPHHNKPPKKTVPTKAARTKPSASALSSAVSGLKQYVHTVFSITSSEVAQFGDDVCTAFDQNKTYSQIKSQITAKVKQLPFTTVTTGAADYVVRTAVKLYCPGYTSRTN